MASDTSGSSEGWRVDTVNIAGCVPKPCPSPTPTATATATRRPRLRLVLQQRRQLFREPRRCRALVRLQCRDRDELGQGVSYIEKPDN